MPAFTSIRFISQEHFPTFAELPEDDDIDLRYYDDPSYGVTGPIKHWCLLVEIVEQIPYLRPMFTVKDKAGKQFLVAFYLDNNIVQPKIWEKRCKVGGVIALMYATSHYFADGQHGVRVEEVENIKFLPCSLDSLLRVGDDLDKPADNKCGSCRSPAAGLQCSRCSVVKYCGKDCQTRDWKMRHKNECVVIQQVAEWMGKDWEDFDEYWMD
ncbi:hypothetical protein BDZ97DRAFT_1658154 [Flammula alnicola]|nr:hypothetical protein BDZ97DRAFT_1658154 [Flammula alnicola]